MAAVTSNAHARKSDADMPSGVLSLCLAIAIFGIPRMCEGLRDTGLGVRSSVSALVLALVTVITSVVLAHVVQTGGDVITQSSPVRCYVRHCVAAALLLGTCTLGQFVMEWMKYTRVVIALSFSSAFLVVAMAMFLWQAHERQQSVRKEDKTRVLPVHDE